MVCSGATQIILRPSPSEAGVFLHDLAPCDASAIIVASELRFFPTAEASRPARALCSHGIFLGLLGTALRGTHFGRKVCFPRIFFSFVHHRIAAKTRKLRTYVHHASRPCCALVYLVHSKHVLRMLWSCIPTGFPVAPGAGGRLGSNNITSATHQVVVAMDS